VSRGPLSPSLQRHPDLDTWIRIEEDGSVTVFTGKVELGQALATAIARIAAEELDVSLAQVRVHTADTAEGPDEFMTVGSQSLEDSGNAMRAAAAEARQALLERAAAHLGAPLSSLSVEDGTVRSRAGPEVTYRELLGGRRFERRVTGEARPKLPAEHTIVGRPGPRIDLREKLTGGAFVQDLVLPGMLYGRAVRPPSLRARLLEVDEDAARKLPGVVAVVRDGSFLGVVAEREEQAITARERLLASARWEEAADLPPEDDLAAWMLAQPCESYPVIEGAPRVEPVPPQLDPPGASATLEATYVRPYQMHASIGPSAAVALWDGGHLTVHSHSQGVSLLRLSIAQALGLESGAVRVVHAPGPGCYGHNGADDAAFDAALLARAVPGRPVRLQWMRDDEHAFEPLAPAMVVRMRGSLDAAGAVIDWSHEAWSCTHLGRPLPFGDRSQLLAAWHRSEPLAPPDPRARMEPHAGIHRNAEPLYAFPRTRIVKHMLRATPLRVSSMRGLGAFANVFAIESFMDELAHAAGTDPIAFRLRHLDDVRARAVIEVAAERAGWRPIHGERRAYDGRGSGVGFARYKNQKAWCAVVVELRVEQDGRIHLERAVVAGDAGQVVDPEGLVAQLEGGFVQAASWTLLERVRFDPTRITSRDWESYPILRCADVPEVETVLIDRPEEPFVGAGEASPGPTGAAIANAVFAATGVRLRDLPFTPARVRAGLGGATGRRGAKG
jgi:nicotinate dehydrogenase subunit B